MPPENRRVPERGECGALKEVSPDPIGLMGPGLPEGFQEASGQGKGDSNPLPWTRDEAVQETAHSSRADGPSALCLTQGEVPLRTFLRGSP